MIAISGIGSTIAQELICLLPEDEQVIGIPRDEESWPETADRFLFCAGLLRPKQIVEQSRDEINESLWANFVRPVRMCEKILAANLRARICIIGSQSGITGSYDGVYAGAKAAIHQYVTTKKLAPNQQLICIAPGIISNSGMTERREDLDNLRRRREEHPKKRFLFASEVANMVYHLLYVDDGYCTSTVIPMDGGANTRLG